MLLLSLAFLYPLGVDGGRGLLSLHPAPLLGTIKMHLLPFVSSSGRFMSPTLFPVFPSLFLMASVWPALGCCTFETIPGFGVVWKAAGPL